MKKAAHNTTSAVLTPRWSTRSSGDPGQATLSWSSRYCFRNPIPTAAWRATRPR